ncbi:MAG TPA: DNA internalization-related competence protein ComEC/Rec2 [Clostridiaceae bacterium]|nr:DNA internalization-related competence protein ComEC/Rec2 [Clostridiaceae bacterium]
MKRHLLLFSIALIIGIQSASITQSYTFILVKAFILFALIFLVSISSIWSISNNPKKTGIRTLLAASEKPGLLDLPPRNSRIPTFPLIGILIFYVIGAVEFLYLDRAITQKYIQFSQQQVTIKGIICSNPEHKDGRIRCEVKTGQVIEVNGANQISEATVNGKILLSIYQKDLSNEKTKLLEYGREIEVTGILTLPTGRRNPGGFDYRRYLAGSRVSAIIYAKGREIKTGNLSGRNILVRTGIAIRDRIVEVINNSLPKEQAALMNAMLTGYREELPEDLKEAFSDSGLIHIMAVSGLHVGFIMLPFVFLFKKIGLKKKIANPIIIFILFIYTLITGYQPSVIRAVIMATIILLGQMTWREPDTLTSISFALIVILLWNPHMLFNIGLQLSFAATASIVLLNKNIKEIFKSKPISQYIPDAVFGVLSTTISAQIGVLPITIINFNKVSMVSILSNLLAAPVAGVIIIIGMIMALLGQISIFLSKIIGYVNCVLLTFVIFVSKISTKLPFAVIKSVTPSILLIIVYYITVWFFFWFKPKYKIRVKTKFYVISTVLLITLILIISIIPGEMEVVFLDVGEGDSAFIQTPTGKTVLIDGGGEKGKSDDELNTGEKVIIPFLCDYGVSKLDLVVATHAHEDHIIGLIKVLSEMKVDNVAIPNYIIDNEFDRLLDICREKRVKVNYLNQGDYIKLDKRTYFEVLNPPGRTEVGELSLNNSSVVLKLCYRDMEILFTGDVEKEGENRIIRNIPNQIVDRVDIRADILKVAHHGSSTSSTQEFLDLVKPKAAIISVGRNNYNHPSNDVIERLNQKGTRIFRTDLNGAILIRSNGKIIKIKVMVNNEH